MSREVIWGGHIRAMPPAGLWRSGAARCVRRLPLLEPVDGWLFLIIRQPSYEKQRGAD